MLRSGRKVVGFAETHGLRVAGAVGFIAAVISVLAWAGVVPTSLGGDSTEPDLGRHIGEYLADLETTNNKVLSAAYEEAKTLQDEGYEAQNEEKHLEAIDRFTRALALAETDEQRAAMHILRGNSYQFVSDLISAEADYASALEVAENVVASEDQARIMAAALGNLGLVYQNQGDLPKAEDHLQQALAIHVKTGDLLGQGSTLGNLGLVYEDQGELAKAEDHHLQALAIHGEIGNRIGEGNALGNLGNIYKNQGDLARAEDRQQQALATYLEIGNRLGEANTLGNLGNIYKNQGDLAKAEDHHQRALVIHREIGHRLGEAQDLHNLGVAAAADGNFRVEACLLLNEALVVFQEVGAEPDVQRTLSNIEELGCGEDG